MNEEKLERYLYRDCLLLALWVHELTGWPVVQLFERDDAGEFVTRHALVRMPDGRLLDAAGAHDSYSGGEPFDPAAWELGDVPEPEWAVWNYLDVRDDAEQLLTELGLAA